MIKQHSLLLLFSGMLLFSLAHAQNDTIAPNDLPKDSIAVSPIGPDKDYREDQFYASLTFNLLSDLPEGVNQSGFSGGIHAGFIRDFPLNKTRNKAIGLGVGWSINSYRTNLLISRSKEQDNSIFQPLDQNRFDYKRNNFSTQLIEVPLQYRWRTSTHSSYKFWRIYAGLRFGYLYYFHSKFTQSDNKIHQTNIDGLNRFRYGATFTFGYNTFNFTVYYSLNPFFDAHTTDGNPVNLSTFKIGLEFYIL